MGCALMCICMLMLRECRVWKGCRELPSCLERAWSTVTPIRRLDSPFVERRLNAARVCFKVYS